MFDKVIEYLYGYGRKYRLLKIQYDALYAEVETLKKGFDRARDFFTIRTKGLEGQFKILEDAHVRTCDKYWKLKHKYEPEEAEREQKEMEALVAPAMAESVKLINEAKKIVDEMIRPS